MVDASEGIQRICYPSLTALVKFDEVAGVWAVSGHGVTPAALDLTDPDAPDDQIIAELYTFPVVYRARIHRPEHSPTPDVSGLLTKRGALKSVSLFWIASFQKTTDWLIFANNMKAAAALHRQEDHCTIDSRRCRRVLQGVHLLRSISGDPPCYAHPDDLVDLGFRVLKAPAGILAVRLGNTAYVEGYQFNAIPEIRDDFDEMRSVVRPNKTLQMLPPIRK